MEGLITFKFLRELQKKERDSHGLQPLDPGVQEQIAEYLARKGRIASRDDFSGSGRRELEHSRVIVRDIFMRRGRKVLEAAMTSLSGGDEPENMLPEEKKLFDSVGRAVKAYGRPLEKLVAGRAVRTQGQKKVRKEEKALPEKKNVMALKFLEGLPKFTAEDMESYGPFKRGDTAEIPEKAAKILIESGKAEKE